MERFLRGRVQLARALAVEIPGASYADVVLIITAVLSACASFRWPGRGIDRKRFVELLVLHSPEQFRTSWVSIPALINGAFISESETPYAGGNADRIFRDHETDLSFDEARTRYGDVPRSELRKHSYASLIYEWLRCGYAHRYCPHENITHVQPSTRNARVSYISRSIGGQVKRMMTFHLDYLLELAEHHVSIVPSAASLRPATWWIDRP